MESVKLGNDNEIGLFELIKIIWDGKIWVILAITLTTGIGSIYIAITPIVYQVGINVETLTDVNDIRRIPRLSKFNWTINKKANSIFLETKQPLDPKLYSEDLEQAVKKITTQLTQSKKQELERIFNLSPALQGTEAVAEIVVHNQSLIYSIEALDLEVMTLSNPKIQVKSPNVKTILALAIVLGLIIGVIGVLIRSGYRH